MAITDSNRRRVLVPSRLAQNAGPVLAADEAPSVDAAVLDPFPLRGSDAQTVAVYGGGIAGVTAPSSPGFPQFPENRPFAALDGDLATHWQADKALTDDRHTLTVRFPRAARRGVGAARPLRRPRRAGAGGGHRGAAPSDPSRLEHAAARAQGRGARSACTST